MQHKMAGILSRLTPVQAQATAQRAGQKVVFHLLCMLYFARIILWHFTPPAELLPGAVGYGWFFKYFTFCSFTAQTVQFLICALDDAIWQPEKPPLRRIADIVSCSMFAMANTVSFMFYTMNYLTGGKAEEPCPHRPLWLSPAVHTYNSIAAWVDILISDTRTFSGSSLYLCLVLSVAYASWLRFVASKNKKFPYPFLNVVKQPHGFIATFVSSTVCMLVWFVVGKLVRKLLVQAWDRGTEWVSSKSGSGKAAVAVVEEKKDK